MASQVISNRVLAGVLFEDIATGIRVDAPLDVRGVEGGVSVVTYPNRRSIYVVSAAGGLEAYVASFYEAPPTPDVGDVVVDLEVRDPGGTYLPRQFSVALPRRSDPALFANITNATYTEVAAVLGAAGIAGLEAFAAAGPLTFTTTAVSETASITLGGTALTALGLSGGTVTGDDPDTGEDGEHPDRAVLARGRGHARSDRRPQCPRHRDLPQTADFADITNATYTEVAAVLGAAGIAGLEAFAAAGPLTFTTTAVSETASITLGGTALTALGLPGGTVTGDDPTPARVVSTETDPYSLADGATLEVTVAPNAPVTVTFQTADPDSVFEPVVVPLMRSPRASRSRNWAMIRVWLGVGMTDEPIAAALLRVVHDPTGDREILGWGMSVVADPRAREIELRAPGRKRWVHFGDRHLGEAAVPVVGLSDQVWGVEPGEDVLLADIQATLEVVPIPLPGPARLPDPSAFFDAIVVPVNTRAVTLSVGGDIHAEPFPVTI